ncbi:hypothetical protein PROFUN_08025 [Planoprotostelium fungivorum]|uniref:Uncharacterized protein n=1 Tax=Planoprotostelium fungivorum TaxID=1890364 RepID=A0A2P6NKE6_9EUKA|nr:hypothetical protein PROFUN_08025 [Planoprotostelium fungivorum]
MTSEVSLIQFYTERKNREQTDASELRWGYQAEEAGSEELSSLDCSSPRHHSRAAKRDKIDKMLESFLHRCDSPFLRRMIIYSNHTLRCTGHNNWTVNMIKASGLALLKGRFMGCFVAELKWRIIATTQRSSRMTEAERMRTGHC